VVAGDDERAKRRLDAFQAAARAAGLREVQVVVVPAPTTLKSGRGALAELMRVAADVDAVFCSSDLLALGVMTEAHARAIKVPEQLAIVGFGDLDFRRRSAPGADHRARRRHGHWPPGRALHRRPRARTRGRATGRRHRFCYRRSRQRLTRRARTSIVAP